MILKGYIDNTIVKRKENEKTKNNGQQDKTQKAID
jgi:hypothetical protein